MWSVLHIFSGEDIVISNDIVQHVDEIIFNNN